MRRLASAAALIGGGRACRACAGSRLHARMLAACEGMFEQMPDDFPPKKMMGGIEEIRANTARTLELLEERTQAGDAEPPARPRPGRRKWSWCTPEARRAPSPVGYRGGVE